jgi:hypothetical protein
MCRTSFSLAIVVLTLPTPELAGPRCGERVVWTHVRAADPTHRELLRQGFERSATFRHLMADIEASPWLVFVQNGPCPEKLTVACLLHFVGTYEGRPYLRVIARHQHRHPDNVLAVLAHELQHAREVTRAFGVEDAGGLRVLFERIGRVRVTRPGVLTYETDEALRVEDAVLRELAQTPSHYCR